MPPAPQASPGPPGESRSIESLSISPEDAERAAEERIAQNQDPAWVLARETLRAKTALPEVFNALPASERVRLIEAELRTVHITSPRTN